MFSDLDCRQKVPSEEKEGGGVNACSNELSSVWSCGEIKHCIVPSSLLSLVQSESDATSSAPQNHSICRLHSVGDRVALRKDISLFSDLSGDSQKLGTCIMMLHPPPWLRSQNRLSSWKPCKWNRLTDSRHRTELTRNLDCTNSSSRTDGWPIFPHEKGNETWDARPTFGFIIPNSDVG